MAAYTKKEGGDKQFNNPQASYRIENFFSSDSGDDWQRLTIGLYGDWVSLNFVKGRKNNPNRSQQYVTLDYETTCAILEYFIEPLIKQRFMKFRNGEEYPVGIWMNYALSFTDKESNQMRTIGNLVLKSEINPSNQRNTVYICYSNGTDEWKVALGSGNLVSRMTMNSPLEAEGFDPNDSRFQQFAYLLRSIVNTWTISRMLNHNTSIMMNNFNVIKNKLGIESKPRYVGKDKGNYTDSNYRSNAPDAPVDSEPAGDPFEDADGFSDQMPF